MFSNEQLLIELWGPEFRNDNNLLHSSMARLRQGLGPTAAGLIRSQRRLGYCLVRAPEVPSHRTRTPETRNT